MKCKKEKEKKKHSLATVVNLLITFTLVNMISLLMSTTHTIIRCSATVTVLKYDTQVLKFWE